MTLKMIFNHPLYFYNKKDDTFVRCWKWRHPTQATPTQTSLLIGVTQECWPTLVSIKLSPTFLPNMESWQVSRVGCYGDQCILQNWVVGETGCRYLLIGLVHFSLDVIHRDFKNFKNFWYSYVLYVHGMLMTLSIFWKITLKTHTEMFSI